MSETWYEDVLVPSDSDLQAVTKSLGKDSLPASIRQRWKESVRGVVRVQLPRWRALSVEETIKFAPRAGARLMAVRLGFEFEVPDDIPGGDTRFVFARCEAFLDPALPGQVEPLVYDVIPRELREGAPRKVSLKFEPKVKLEAVGEIGLGSIGTDVEVGVVEPVCVGFTGKAGREPYWELRPQGHSLLGIRSFWLLVELPRGSEGFRLAARAEGQVRGYAFGVLPVTGKHPTREALPSLFIPAASD